jgi:hypothetical protein
VLPNHCFSCVKWISDFEFQIFGFQNFSGKCVHGGKNIGSQILGFTSVCFGRSFGAVGWAFGFSWGGLCVVFSHHSQRWVLVFNNTARLPPPSSLRPPSSLLLRLLLQFALPYPKRRHLRPQHSPARAEGRGPSWRLVGVMPSTPSGGESTTPLRATLTYPNKNRKSKK